jgi:hypothetical protein
MKVGWLCDIHLNFLDIGRRVAFYEQLRAVGADAFLVGGDIAEAPGLSSYLEELAVGLGVPVYFVLGNHDFYRGSIARTREKAQKLSVDIPNLHWLPAAGLVPLSDECGLVGHGCWGDGRLGDFWGSRVQLNDFRLIKELRGFGAAERLALLHHLGDESASFLRGTLVEAFARYEKVICVTHVPPLLETSWCGRDQSDAEFLPFFACQAAGEVVNEIAAARPDRHLTVLAGHTHMAASKLVRPNLELHIGAATYGEPALQRTFLL